MHLTKMMVHILKTTIPFNTTQHNHVLPPGFLCDRLEADILESLHPPHLALEKTLVHGFPYKPTALAFEPVQHLLAIGNRVGQVRIKSH